jgi:hypothetical protein
MILTGPYYRFKIVSRDNGKSRERDIMKILMIIILCLIVLMAGCSRSCYRGEALWQERQMEDDRRIYGNPYKSYPTEIIDRHRE